MAIEIKDHQLIIQGTEQAVDVARAFATYLKKITDTPYLSIAVGYDGNRQAEEVMERILPALVYDGVDVYDTGFSVSPALFMATLFDEYNCDGSIMVYHNNNEPKDETTLKFFYKGGQLDNDQLHWIVSIARKKEFIHYGRGSLTKSDLMKVYAQTLRTHLGRKASAEDYRDLHVITGSPALSGQFLAEEVFEPLGINTEGSMWMQQELEDEQIMEALRNSVLIRDADYGLFVNPDFSRLQIVEGGQDADVDFFEVFEQREDPREQPDLFEVTASSIFHLIMDLDSPAQLNYPSLEAYREQLLEDLKNFCMEAYTLKNVVPDEEGATLYLLDGRKKRSNHLDVYQVKDRLMVVNEEPLFEEAYEELSSFLSQYPSVDLSRLKGRKD